MSAVVSLHGNRLGLGSLGNLETQTSASEGIDLTPPCANATISIGDESANVRIITIQLEDANGVARAASDIVTVFVFADAGGLALATGGSTGIAISTDGAIFDTVVAKKIFTINSEADGDIDLTWTDTGTEAVYLGVRLPGGRMVISDVIQNAA